MIAILPSPAGRGALFLVPNALDLGTPSVDTPLDEVLPRAVLRTAARLDHWIVENAKSARLFLKRVDAVMPLARPLQAIAIVELPRPPKGRTSPATGNAGEPPRPPGGRRPTADAGATSSGALAALLEPARHGHDIGLLSEAGLPAVADPGARVVAAAHASGLTVVPLAGASSLLLALAASGLNGQSFQFVGYLPVDSTARAARIRELEGLSRRLGQTQLAIETPYRNAALLQALSTHLQPATRLAVACGLTLPNGWNRTDTVAGWRSRPATVPDDTPAVYAFLADGCAKPAPGVVEGTAGTRGPAARRSVRT